MCIGVFNGPRALAARAGTRWVGEDGAAAAAPGGQLCFLSWGGLVDTWAPLLIPHASLKAARPLRCYPVNMCAHACALCICSNAVCVCLRVCVC